jgi:hypothetical protein
MEAAMDKRNESDSEELSKKEMKNTKGGAAIAVAREKLQVDAPAESLVEAKRVLPIAKA